jgi:uncharacterized protein
MPNRNAAPVGSPCWADLWTSDVEGSRKFYSEIFGWEAQEPSAEFGGYFMFTRNGVPIAGGMGDMAEMRADNKWKVYLATDDLARTAKTAEADGARLIAPPMAVADLGSQLVLIDPTGANLGAWQAGTFPGFTVLNEPGTPSWFELLTRDYGRAVGFYRSAFGWETAVVSDTDEFRYTVMKDPSGQGELAGIMDAAGFLPEGAPSYWAVYWEVDNIDDVVTKVEALRGSVSSVPEDTPYGRIATVTDPAGAEFKLRTGG